MMRRDPFLVLLGLTIMRRSITLFEGRTNDQYKYFLVLSFLMLSLQSSSYLGVFA